MSNSMTETAAQEQKDYGPATSITTESLPATPLVYSAYGAAWVVLILYLFVLARRLTRMEHALRDVSARITGRSLSNG